MGGRVARFADLLRKRHEIPPRHAPSLVVQRQSDGDAQDVQAPSADRGQPSTALGQDEKHARPEMAFALPAPQPGGEGGPEPSQTATENGGGAEAGEIGPKPAPAPQQADARAVADRVYELMKQEVVLARLRGAGTPGRR
jgi:hypothetical protein